jgi:Tol biopolymer transport system component
LYASGSPMGSGLALHRLDASVETPIARPPVYLTLTPTGISRDGEWMAAANLFTGANRTVILSLDSLKLAPVEEMPIHTVDATFSPDGRWLLYSALVNGRRDVYVRPTRTQGAPADARGPWLISPTGGVQPAWRADGKEIFYLAANGMMTAVPVETAAGNVRPGTPVPLFRAGLTEQGMARDYDVAPDGKHFLLPVTQSGAAVEAPITVIVNWPKLLDRK